MAFTSIFVILLSFLIIFAESQLIFYIGGILGIFYLSQRKRLNFQQIELLKNKKLGFYRALSVSLFSILILLLYLPINSYLGIAWGQSLTRYFSLLVGFSSFIVFLFYDKNFFPDEKILFDQLFKLMKILSVLVLFLMFLSRTGDLLPKVNLLYASYGHNHFATLLVLFMPYFWQNIVLAKKLKKKSEIYWLLLFYIMLILSFARVAIILAILQLLTMTIINFRQLKKLSPPEQKTLKNTGLFLLLITTYFVVFLFKFNTLSNVFCESNSSRFQHFCKDISQDDRHIYWKHAIDFFNQKPIIGHGLNSFVLVFRQQSHSDVSVAKYVHNEFLQIMSDTGWIGSILFFTPFFVFLVLSIIFVLRKPIYRNQALLLGIIAVYLIAFFDFDWQFTAVFSLILIFLALILRQNLFFSKKFKSNQLLHSKSFSLRVAYLIFFVSNFLIVLISTTYLASELFRKFYLSNQAFRSFPLLEGPEYSATIDSFSQENKDLIFDIYRNDAVFLLNYFEYTKDDYLKKKIYLQILDLNPKFVSNAHLLEFFKTTDLLSWEEKVEILLKISGWANKETVYLENKDLAIDIKYKQLIGPLLLEMADEAFLRNELELAGKFYYQFYLLNTWQLKDYKPVFLEAVGEAKHADFLNEFIELNPDLFYQNYELYYRFYVDSLTDLFFNLDYSNFKILADKFVKSKFQEKFYDFAQELMVSLIKELGSDIRVQQERKQWLIANFMHFFIENPNYDWPWEEKEKLARKLWSFYRQLELSELELAERFQKDALAIAPEIAWQLSQIQ